MLRFFLCRGDVSYSFSPFLSALKAESWEHPLGRSCSWSKSEMSLEWYKELPPLGTVSYAAGPGPAGSWAESQMQVPNRLANICRSLKNQTKQLILAAGFYLASRPYIAPVTDEVTFLRRSSRQLWNADFNWDLKLNAQKAFQLLGRCCANEGCCFLLSNTRDRSEPEHRIQSP